MFPQVLTPERQFFVYLAGPVTGLSFEEATGWYRLVEAAFPRHIIALKPLRGVTHFRGEGVTQEECPPHPLRSAKGVAMRCYYDVDRADGLLVNLLPAKGVSRGTCGEIGRAAWRKPLVVVMREGNPHWGDPLVHEPAIVVPTLEEGIATIVQLISPV
ncbi:MAG TPA: hypothetical protein VJJ02_01740 [Candidatus Paceibacterota bacterium]